MSFGITLSILTMAKNGRDYSYLMERLSERNKQIVEQEIKKLKERMKEAKDKEVKNVK